MNTHEIIQNLEGSLAAAQQQQIQAFAAYREEPSSQTLAAWESASREQQAAVTQLVIVKEAVQEHTQAHGIAPTHPQLIQHLEAEHAATSRESAALGEATITDGSSRAMTAWTTAIQHDVATKEALAAVRDLSTQQPAPAATRDSLTREYLQNPTRENEQKLQDFISHSDSGPASHAHAHSAPSHGPSSQHSSDHGHSSHSGSSHSDSGHGGHSHD